MRLFPVLLLALAAVTACDLPADPPPPPADRGRILFQRADGLYSIRPDGTDLRSIPGTGDVFSADWSPNRDRVVFSATRDVQLDGTTWLSSTDIYVIAADGTGVRRVTQPLEGSHAMGPVWSPDGARIAYARFGEEAGLYTVNVDGSGSTRIHSGGWWPQWSADGSSILFRTGTRMAIVGSQGGTMQPVPTGDLAVISMSWRADGQIVFEAGPDAGPRHLYLVRPDGSGLQEVVKLEGASHQLPVWAPDGNGFVFRRDWRDPGLYQRISAGAETRITAWGASEFPYSWR
jgi:TolB protein